MLPYSWNRVVTAQQLYVVWGKSRCHMRQVLNLIGCLECWQLHHTQSVRTDYKLTEQTKDRQIDGFLVSLPSDTSLISGAFIKTSAGCCPRSLFEPKRCLIEEGFCPFSLRRTEVLPRGVARCGWEMRPPTPPPTRRVAYSTEPLHKQENQTFRPHYVNRVTHQASKARPIELTRQNSNVKSLISVSPPPLPSSALTSSSRSFFTSLLHSLYF